MQNDKQLSAPCSCVCLFVFLLHCSSSLSVVCSSVFFQILEDLLSERSSFKALVFLSCDGGGGGGGGGDVILLFLLFSTDYCVLVVLRMYYEHSLHAPGEQQTDRQTDRQTIDP